MIEARYSKAQRLRAPFLLMVIAALAACATTTQDAANPALEPGVFAATRDGPDDAPDGSCWGKTVSPAVVETVTEQVQVKPAKVNSDGSIGSLPVYRTEKRQVIVKSRVDNWFETPCPDAMGPEFVASLQRALQARGGYAGDINGFLDVSTRKAVQLFQLREQGLDSSVLSLKTARVLGLIAIKRELIE